MHALTDPRALSPSRLRGKITTANGCGHLSVWVWRWADGLNAGDTVDLGTYSSGQYSRDPHNSEQEQQAAAEDGFPLPGIKRPCGGPTEIGITLSKLLTNN